MQEPQGGDRCGTCAPRNKRAEDEEVLSEAALLLQLCRVLLGPFASLGFSLSELFSPPNSCSGLFIHNVMIKVAFALRLAKCEILISLLFMSYNT